MIPLSYFLKITFKRLKYKHLVHTYRNEMLQTAYAILKNESLAEEAVCKAFSNIIPHLELLIRKDTNEAKTFLLIVTKYAALDIQRETNQNIAQSFQEDFLSSPISNSISTFISTSSSTPVSLSTLPITSRTSFSQLSQTLSKSEPICQDLLTLLYLYDLKLEDAASLLNLNPQIAGKILEHFLSCEETSHLE